MREVDVRTREFVATRVKNIWVSKPMQENVKNIGKIVWSITFKAAIVD